ncbi:MAG: hypothetical protein HC859_15145, partial [Bacteroidia bacterium]|nr:hypothetical protein [Bacteroidia bacterium]
MNNYLRSPRIAGFFLGPLVFVIVRTIINNDFISPGADLVIALGLWMLIWWVSDAAPIPVTALLPLIIFPAAGIMKINEATVPYANPSIFLFMGGFMIAIALEKHRLHERLAINLIRLTGTTGNGIILGFTLASGFMSMWISNTATALMMLPIAVSVIDLLKDKHESIAEQKRQTQTKLRTRRDADDRLLGQHRRHGYHHRYTAQRGAQRICKTVLRPRSLLSHVDDFRCTGSRVVLMSS